MEPLQLAFIQNDRSIAEKIALSLSEGGFEVTLVQKSIDPKKIVLVLLTKDSVEKELYSSFPWLKEQNDFSSYRGFRLMPLFAYDSTKEDPEKIFEGEFGEMMEEVFSGEFKPFGWDLSEKKMSPEFVRVLEEGYSE